MSASTPSTSSYLVYGLRLLIDQPIPDLPMCSDEAPADVVVECGPVTVQRALSSSGQPLHASPGLAPNGEPFLQVWRDDASSTDHVILRYTDGTSDAVFAIDRSGRRVRITWTAAMSFQDVCAYLLGPVIGCVLRLRGTTALHGGVLAIEEKAVVIIGPQGTGKSTLITAFARMGVAVMADDQAPLTPLPGRETLLVESGYPRLRVWPATAEGVGGLVADSLPRVLLHADKRYVELTERDDGETWRFHRGRLPLGAIYQLADRTTALRLGLSTPSTRNAFLGLTANTYAPYLLDGSQQRKDMQLLGRIASTVPIRLVERLDDLGSVSRLCETILTDLPRLQHSRGVTDTPR